MTRTVILALALVLASHASAQVTFRLGLGHDTPQSTTIRDANCGSTTPPALFGCVDGLNGARLGARGETGATAVVEAAAGLTLTRRLTTEVTLAWRPDTDVHANANFLGVAPLQPVSASGSSLALLAGANFDLGRAHWPLRPFLAATAGISRNSLGEVTYAFPSIAPEAVTITPGGTNTGFAWTAGLGVAVPVTPRLSLEFLVRHADLGEFETAGGATTIVRPTRTLTINTAPTTASLRTRGVSLSLRWR